jgi:hypothetical protein
MTTRKNCLQVCGYRALVAREPAKPQKDPNLYFLLSRPISGGSHPFPASTPSTLPTGLPVPLYGHKGHVQAGHSRTSAQVQPEQSRHFLRMAVRAVRDTVSVPPDLALMVCFTAMMIPPIASVCFVSRLFSSASGLAFPATRRPRGCACSSSAWSPLFWQVSG